MQMVEYIEPTDAEVLATLRTAITSMIEQGLEPAPFKNEVQALLHKYKNVKNN